MAARRCVVALRTVGQELGVALDDHRKIVEIVRDAAGERAPGRHLLGLAKQGVQPLLPGLVDM